MDYWRSLLGKDRSGDPRLAPGHLEEIRVALRDAIHELEDVALRMARDPGGIRPPGCY